MKEQEYFVLLKATMNSIEPMPKPKSDVVPARNSITRCEETITNKVYECKKRDSNSKVEIPVWFECKDCVLKFHRKYHLDRHIATKKHKDKVENVNLTKTFPCSCCSKVFVHASSRSKHQSACKMKTMVPIKEVEALRSQFEKEKEAMQKQIEDLLLSSKTNQINTNIGTQVNININAFGNENIDYLDDKSILACIDRVYRSIPSLLEKIYFDPKHPENHNIKITNKKLPYASVMGVNQKWKTVDRKDAIDTMVTNGYNLLDEKYAENKDKLPPSKQQRFEGFQSRFETEDKEVMKQIKSEVDIMVLNGSGNNE